MKHRVQILRCLAGADLGGLSLSSMYQRMVNIICILNKFFDQLASRNNGVPLLLWSSFWLTTLGIRIDLPVPSKFRPAKLVESSSINHHTILHGNTFADSALSNGHTFGVHYLECQVVLLEASSLQLRSSQKNKNFICRVVVGFKVRESAISGHSCRTPISNTCAVEG